MPNAEPPFLSEAITALIVLQGIIGDQRVTLARWVEDDDEADVPLPGIPGFGLKIWQSGNGKVTP